MLYTDSIQNSGFTGNSSYLQTDSAAQPSNAVNQIKLQEQYLLVLQWVQIQVQTK